MTSPSASSSNAQLSQAEKLSSIGLLAAGVAHEVNTPLAVISSYAQMLAKQVSGDEKKSSLLEKITRQTFRASEIVNGLLNFSRTSGTEFARSTSTRSSQDTLDACWSTSSRPRSVKVQDDLAANLPPIHGNSGQTAAGLSEPVPERERRDARWRRR